VDLTRALEYGGGSGNSRRFESSPPPPPDRGTRRRDYKRDKDGQFNEVDERGGGRSARERRPMTAHELHVAHVEHVRRVKGLQKLLNKLGLADLAVDGKFGPETKKVVNALQRKLGLPPTGRVDGQLMRRLRDVEILSPCATGAKRSKEIDELDELIRGVMLADPDEDLEDLEEDDDAQDLELVGRAYNRDSDEPYGDVDYADPGYQDDGKRRYPLDSEEHCRAAWSYINMPRNAAKYSPDELKRVKARIRSALEEYGVETETERSMMMRCCPEEHTFAREWPLDDIVIRAGGDGRTVEAYAAVFGVPTEVKDQHGHYMETIDRAAFNEVLAGGIDKVGCFYHHGMTLHGTPSDLGSVPIGSPIEIRPDGKGLRTITRFNRSPLADSVLEAIRSGDLKGYSFRGGIKRSNPPRIARARTGGPLPTVTRMSLGLNEYGPTPTPYYADAKILAVRSAQTLATHLTDPEFKRELITILSRSTPTDQEQEPATPTEGPGAEDQPHEALRSASMNDIRRRIAVFKILGGKQ
jgi:HK97 family phage prohead protease